MLEIHRSEPAPRQRPTVFMFSGQGSQYFHMGAPLFQRDRLFRESMERMDEIVKARTGASVIDVLYSTRSDKGDPFDRLSLTHPALFMVQYALVQVLRRAGVEPHLTLGASLGSFVAASVSGLLDADEALECVIRHALIVEQRCPPGGMLAILAPDSLLSEAFLRDHCEPVAINFDTHFVVAAPLEACAAIEAELRRRQLTYQRLPVSFAFHSRWIESAQDALCASAQRLRRRPALIPMMCCQRTQVLTELHERHFWEVARHPIRFRDAVWRLEESGAHRYIDLGPAGTLATFLKYCLPRDSESTAHPIMTQFGRDAENLAALVRG